MKSKDSEKILKKVNKLFFKDYNLLFKYCEPHDNVLFHLINAKRLFDNRGKECDWLKTAIRIVGFEISQIEKLVEEINENS